MKNIILIISFLYLSFANLLSQNSYKWELLKQLRGSNFFTAIEKADSVNLMALIGYAGAFRYIIKSTDAGISWNTAFQDTVFPTARFLTPNDLAYPTKDFCIEVGDSNYYLKTTDGGINWKLYRADIKYQFLGLRKISMFDNKNGVISTATLILVSNDGFETFDTIPNPKRYIFIDLFMTSEKTINVLCLLYDDISKYDYKLIKSYDFGKSWIEFDYPDYILPVKLFFVDSLLGFTAGDESINIGDQKRDLIYKTTDGGKNWKKVLDTICWPQFGLQDINFFDKESGIAVGQFGKIYWTHDGGENWVRDSNELIVDKIPATMVVNMVGKHTAIIADFRGRIFRSSLITEIEAELDYRNINELYPNPAKEGDNVFFKLPPGFVGKLKYLIYNSIGALIESHYFDYWLDDEIKINTSGQPPGLYIIKIQSNDNVITRKYIIVR